MLLKFKIEEWTGNVKNDILAGMVVAIALIPEAIGFSIIAGVDPMVGLYASFCIAIVVAFLGGRLGMISAATGAMALLMVDLVKDHGLEYLLFATIVTGIIQFVLGYLRMDKLMKFVPRSVMIGFVNALAILIFMAQLENFKGAGILMYLMVGATLLILYGFPKITKVVPSALVAIVLITIGAIFFKLDLKSIGDMGNLTQTLPVFAFPKIAINLESLMIVLPTALAMSVVGLLESLLTASIVDDMTMTSSDKKREIKAQGVANVVAGFFGGMAGCAMIGQSVINVSSGGRKRLSTFVAGVFLIILIVTLGDFVKQIPMAALVAVMITVSVGTFDWKSFSYLKKAPKTDAFVMVTTVVMVIFTHNLAIGVLAGVVLSALFFMMKISKVEIIKQSETVYQMRGQLFFASTEDFTQKLKEINPGPELTLDVSSLHIWDDSGVSALYKIIHYYEPKTKITIIGLNAESEAIFTRLKSHMVKSGH